MESMNRAFKGIWISAEIWLNKNITLMEKVFLVEIDSLDNSEGCFASNDYFSKFFGLSKNRCSEIIKSLEKKELVSISYLYKPNTKLIEKRVIKVLDKSNTGIRNLDRGIRNFDKGCSENCEDNNTYINNTINNSMYINKENKPINNLKEFSNLYEKNIGLINGIAAEEIMHMSEHIDIELFKRAITIANDKGKCNWGYVKGILKQWTDKNITTYEQLEAFQLQKSNKEVKPDVRRGKGSIEAESPDYNGESEEARLRREKLLEECKRVSK